MITIYLAYLAITYDTKSMKEELLIELRNTNQISIEREVKSYMEKLNSKNKDSVLLNFVK
jgi:ribosomal protein L12E/L44/L45/RPP1/RPP2